MIIIIITNIRTQLIILFVVPDLPIPLGFEKPMHSLKTGEMVSLSEYVKHPIIDAAKSFPNTFLA